jgi:hypothetical protein
MFADEIYNASSISLSQLIDPNVTSLEDVLTVSLFCELVCLRGKFSRNQNASSLWRSPD